MTAQEYNEALYEARVELGFTLAETARIMGELNASIAAAVGANKRYDEVMNSTIDTTDHGR